MITGAGCVTDEALHAFANRALEPAAVGAVEEHVAACRTCRVVLAELSRSPGSAGARETLRPGASLGRYVLGECVGVGGMGAVYAATDPTLGRRVAIKVLHEAARDASERAQRFARERQILAALDHPNIARVLDGGETPDGRAFVVLEFVEGLPIDRYCDERRLGTRARLALFGRVCEAVEHAHQHQVVHRDLKPGNILVTLAGEPKLLDFGIAKLLEPPPGVESLTSTGTAPMTPAWAAPEQVVREAVTPATDVYSLGVVLYELLTGLSPYRVGGRSVEELLRAIRLQVPERPSAAAARTSPAAVALREATPEALHQQVALVDDVVLAALRKDPAGRCPSARRLAEDLRRALDSPAQSGSRRRARAAVAAAVTVLLVGAGATAWRAHQRPDAADQALAAPPVLLGPLPYRSAAQSPFAGTPFAWQYLEDMEDGMFNVSGAFINAAPTSSSHPDLIDSVDGDDGDPTNGACESSPEHRCDSLFTNDGRSGVFVQFDERALGGLPTHVGLVWTDGKGLVRFEAWGADGGSLGVVGPVSSPGFPDDEAVNTTAEDRFFGVIAAGGVSRVRLSNSGGAIEVDHVQYGRAR